MRKLFDRSLSASAMRRRVWRALARARTRAARAVARGRSEDRERIAEALRTTRERYRRLVETANDIIYTHDLEGTILSLNRAGERLTGYSREEARGRNIAEFVAPEQLKLARRMIDLKVAEGGATTYEVEFVARDGERIPVEVSTQLIREGDRAVGVQGIARQIAERRRVEGERARRLDSERRARERAEAGQRRWRFLAEAGSLLASSLDYETTLKTIARLAVPTLADYVTIDMRVDGGGIRRVETAHVDAEKERIAWEIARRYPPYAARRSAVARTLREGRAILIAEVPEMYLRRIAADEHHLELLRRLEMRSGIVAPLVAHGRTLGSLTFVVTESDRHYGEEDLAFAEALADRAALAADNARLYREAQEAIHAKTDFLAVISHELRTPLTSIITCTELLESGILGDPTKEQRTQLDHIFGSANELLGLIEEILAFSRVEAGGEEVRLEVVEVGPFVRQVAALIEPIAAERRLEFRIEAPEDTSIRTDGGKLRKILLNLLSNAVKFTEEGSVELRVSLAGDVIVFSVEDTGGGIAAEDRERIFQPFWQVDGPDTRRVGGAGLGLSVTRRFARMLGGDVTVESEPDAGSTFTVRLPINVGARER